MRKRTDKMRDGLAQYSGPRPLVARGSARRNMSAAAAFTCQPTFFLEFGVRAGNGIWGNAQIARELSHRRKRIAAAHIPTLDKAAQLVHDLLERRSVEVRIDRQKKFVHEDNEHDERESRCWDHMIHVNTHTANIAQTTSETRRKSRCTAVTTGESAFTKPMKAMTLPTAITAVNPALLERHARSRMRSNCKFSPASCTGELARRHAIVAMTRAQNPTINAAASCSLKMTYGVSIRGDIAAMVTQTVGTASAAGRGASDATRRLCKCSLCHKSATKTLVRARHNSPYETTAEILSNMARAPITSATPATMQRANAEAAAHFPTRTPTPTFAIAAKAATAPTARRSYSADPVSIVLST